MIPHEVLRKLICNPVDKTLTQATLSHHLSVKPLKAGLQHLPLESVDFSGSKTKMDGLQQFQQEAWSPGSLSADEIIN